MDEIYSVPLADLVAEFHLDIAYKATDYESVRLTVEDVSRPGLQVAGYFDHFEPVRLQVMGNVEMRVKVTLACSECKQRNYNTTKNKKNNPDRIELNKYCRFCKKHTTHKETK